MEKIYISANELLLDSFKLAEKVCASGFRPNFIVGVLRGGASIAIAIHEYMEYVGISAEFTSIRASSYTGINQQQEDVFVDSLDYAFKNMDADDRILLVDDVMESGRTIRAIFDEMEGKMGGNVTRNIKVATPWYKPKMTVADMKPDFYIHETTKWLVFPHELKGLTDDEIKKNKPDIADTVLMHTHEKDIR